MAIKCEGQTLLDGASSSSKFESVEEDGHMAENGDHGISSDWMQDCWMGQILPTIEIVTQKIGPVYLYNLKQEY